MVFCAPQGTGALLQVVVGGAGSYKLTIVGPGLNYQMNFVGHLNVRDLTLPVADSAYTETYTNTITNQIVYQDIIWSANNANAGLFMQEQLLSSVTLAFSTGYPGTNFPYTVGIRIPGQSAMYATHTFSGASGDGSYNWQFGNLPASTKYEWVIVQGATINVNDPATINFLTHHHVATNSF